MRSLNTSLPASTPASNRSQPPEQLLQAFKTAALSVTNLYKTAVSDEAQARHAGYQEALEDIKSFLDREKLGIEDSEASKVRNWVTDRIDPAVATETDDDRGDSEKRSRSVSPTAVRKENPEGLQVNHPSRPDSPPRPEAVPSQPQTNTASECDNLTRPAAFTFTAEPQYPTTNQDIDMQANDASQSPTHTQTDPHFSTTAPSMSSPPVRVEVLPRQSRNSHRPNNSNRHVTRSSTREPTVGAGSKRKFHFGDFFDLSNFGNGKDMFGGGKRGRFT